MASGAWLQALNLILDAAEASDGDKVDLQNLLFGTYRLLERGEQDVKTAFEGLSEEQLSADVAVTGEALSSGNFSAGKRPTDVPAGVWKAANLLRSLEHALGGLRSGTKPRRAEELAVKFDGHAGWLLPFQSRFRGEPADWPPYFAKRALTTSRCISASLATGHKVKLRLLDAEFGDVIVGSACLFKDLKLVDQNGRLVDEDSSGPIVISRIDGRDPAAIAAALEASCRPEAAAALVVFPELAVTPDESRKISKLLGSRPWDPALNGHRPAMVIAGSWHHQRPDGEHENRAPVLTGAGRLIDYHIKIMTFGENHHAGVLKEDIQARGRHPGSGVADAFRGDRYLLGFLPNGARQPLRRTRRRLGARHVVGRRADDGRTRHAGGSDLESQEDRHLLGAAGRQGSFRRLRSSAIRQAVHTAFDGARRCQENCETILTKL